MAGYVVTSYPAGLPKLIMSKKESTPRLQFDSSLPVNAEIKELDSGSNMDEVISADASVCNTMLAMLYKSWEMVYTVDHAISLAKATTDLVGARRVLLNKDMGASGQPQRPLGKIVSLD